MDDTSFKRVPRSTPMLICNVESRLSLLRRLHEDLNSFGFDSNLFERKLLSFSQRQPRSQMGDWERSAKGFGPSVGFMCIRTTRPLFRFMRLPRALVWFMT